MVKKALLTALFCALLLSPVRGDTHRINTGPGGEIDHFWLQSTTQETWDLLFSRSYSEAATLYSFTREVADYSAIMRENRCFIAYLQDQELRLVYSSDYGRSFSSPISIAEAAEQVSLAAEHDRLALAWEKDGLIFAAIADARGNFPDAPLRLEITGEALSLPAISIMGEEIQLLCASKDPNTGQNRIIFSRLDGSEPKEIFRTLEQITGTAINGGLLFWRTDSSAYARGLLDGDEPGAIEHLGPTDPVLAAFIKDNALVLVEYNDRVNLKNIELEAPPCPEIFFPAVNVYVKTSEVTVTYHTGGAYNSICRFEVSKDQSFPANETSSFQSTAFPGTNEFKLPPISDGSYYLRISAFNGFVSSLFSNSIEFTIDTIPPTLIDLKETRIKDTVNLAGKVDSTLSQVTINDLPASLESDDTFSGSFILAAGSNIFTILISDEAGNHSILTKEVIYNTETPEITVIKPNNEEWFRAGSTILIQAETADEQDDIDDQAEAQVTINGQLLDDTLDYDREDKMLYGFVTLPEDLNDGNYNGTISIADQAGNLGTADFKMNIDNSSPAMFIENGAAYSGSTSNVILPIADAGAGIDPSGTIIKISGVSFEGTANIESGQLSIAPLMPLSEGSYEVEILPRDLIGNTGEAAVFSLIIDTTPPTLTLTGSYESRTSKNRMNIQGNVQDNSPVTINIYNNQNKVASFSRGEGDFSEEIILCQGENNILIEACDPAANTACAAINVTSTASSAYGLIESYVHGPNPFSPNRKLPAAFAAEGRGMVFTYSLSQPSDVKIMVFDITGTLIWIKEIRNTSQGLTAWSGVDKFGQPAGNGIYPCVFSVKSGGMIENRRSKIVIFNQ